MSLLQARKALEANEKLLANHPAALNTNAALLALVTEVDRISRDVELLHKKLQALLSSSGVTENDWRLFQGGVRGEPSED
jgi:hypothetical protein